MLDGSVERRKTPTWQELASSMRKKKAEASQSPATQTTATSQSRLSIFRQEAASSHYRIESIDRSVDKLNEAASFLSNLLDQNNQPISLEQVLIGPQANFPVIMLRNFELFFTKNMPATKEIAKHFVETVYLQIYRRANQIKDERIARGLDPSAGFLANIDRNTKNQ